MKIVAGCMISERENVKRGKSIQEESKGKSKRDSWDRETQGLHENQ
jgi:hypothetical protein